MVEVLPAPLGPRRAVTAPASAANDTPSTATGSPWRTTSWSTSTAALTAAESPTAPSLSQIAEMSHLGGGASTQCGEWVGAARAVGSGAVIDLRLLRSDPDAVRAALARRGDDVAASIDPVLDLDARRRAATGERDELRARVNAISKEVGALFRDGRRDDAAGLQDESRRLGEREKELDAEVAALDTEVRDRLLRIPNVPSPDAPDGAGE